MHFYHQISLFLLVKYNWPEYFLSQNPGAILPFPSCLIPICKFCQLSLQNTSPFWPFLNLHHYHKATTDSHLSGYILHTGEV